MQTDVASGHRERVDPMVVDDEEPKAVGAVVGMAPDLRADGLDVFVEQGVVDDDAVVAELEHDASPELALSSLVENRVRRTTEIRQLVGRRRYDLPEQDEQAQPLPHRAPDPRGRGFTCL